MEIVQPKQFERSTQKQTTSVPIARGQETAPYAFQWLLYKPQLHAVEPFRTNEPSRQINTARGLDTSGKSLSNE
jgi:hypothetical protein